MKIIKLGLLPGLAYFIFCTPINKVNFFNSPFNNKPGVNGQIEYLDPLHRKCIGKVKFVEPHNAKWIVSYDFAKTWDRPYDAISTVDNNGTAWRTKFVIDERKQAGDNRPYKTYWGWLEHLHGAPGWKRGTIHILDWSNKR